MSNIITISCLGNKGRFGNQLFQYAFAKTYAERNDCTLQVPDNWVGRKIFNVPEEPISNDLPKVTDSEMYSLKDWNRKNIDLTGYFQQRKATSYLSKSKCKEWLRIRPEILEKCDDKRADVAVHLRRGDLVTQHSKVYPIISKKSILEAITNYGFGDKEVLWVSDGDGNKRDSRFPKEYDFIGDFVSLIRAKIIFRTNSTFGWWACTLQESGACFSPLFMSSLKLEVDADYMPGNEYSVFGGASKMPIGE